MKRFLIKYTYRLDSASTDSWHGRVAAFIAALDADPALKGRVTYRCMKVRDGADYYHLAEVADPAVGELLQQRAFFRDYTAETTRVAGGLVEVLPLDTLAETAAPA
jgi:hypothetical protein